ncbi:phosphotransferase [Cryptosporangium arvum]|uniref:phosphotransferase n=1 Tax=Cryptosporangium arvum TaxID=80871 RepID=UPI0004AEB4C9|nr:phosphotransferase [Cryptosporangium arvum]
MPAPGPLLASGRWSDVYALDAHRVLRRCRDPAGRPEWEPDVMRLARDGGVPVPAVLDVDGADMVLERVDGPTMLADLQRHPWRGSRHARTLADLHERVHAVTAPPSLRTIGAPGDRLLHLDLHPANVLLADTGPVVIDWQGAARGAAATDLAQTYVLLVTSTVPGRTRERAVGRAGQGWFARLFRTAAGRTALEAALPAVAERRLADPSVRAEEVRRIHRLLRVRR